MTNMRHVPQFAIDASDVQGERSPRTQKSNNRNPTRTPVPAPTRKMKAGAATAATQARNILFGNRTTTSEQSHQSETRQRETNT
ncbi:hypothetical protein ACMA1D_00610 [Streptomyces sp. 796.1]|uniref:hypothetical protein n=1 Tax=Streptomyces sp. 796.1 TaxID=3163029 RepID=UPI0039C8C0D2